MEAYWVQAVLLLGIVIELLRQKISLKSILITAGIVIGAIFLFVNSLRLWYLGMDAFTLFEIGNFLFLILFPITIAIRNQAELTPQIHRTATVFLTLTFWYFLIIQEPGIGIMIAIVLFPVMVISSICTFLEGLSDKKLIPETKLVISVWNCIMMICFGIYYFISISKLLELQNTGNLAGHMTFLVLQVLILGMATPYIIYYGYMILRFFVTMPFISRKQELKLRDKMQQKHIDRVSNKPSTLAMKIGLAVHASILALNIWLELIPHTTMIWIAFNILPWLCIWVTQKIINQK